MQIESLIYVDRNGTDCAKWDGVQDQFGVSGLLPLWIADMDFQAPACVRSALSAWAAHGVYGYYRAPDRYLSAFLRWEKERHGYAADPRWVRYSPGIVAALYWLVQILSKPGDPVTVLTPVYYPFFEAIRDNGRKLSPCPLSCEAGRYTIDFDRLDRHFAETGSKLLIFCSPHNPVGRVWRREELEQLDQVCLRHGVTVVSDEIHQDLVLGDHPHIPSATVLSSPVVTCCSASKTFNLAGLKNSFVLLPSEDIRKKWDDLATRIHLLDSPVSCGAAPGYVAAAAAFSGGLPWLNSLLDRLRENDQALCAEFADRLPEAVISPLEGTYLPWVDLRPYLRPEEVQRIVQDACGLAVDYGEQFGGDAWKGFIRLNLATSLDNVMLAASRLIAALTD